MYSQYHAATQIPIYSLLSRHDNGDTLVQYWNRERAVYTSGVYHLYNMLVDDMGLSNSSSFGDQKPRISVLHICTLRQVSKRSSLQIYPAQTILANI